MQKDMTRIMRKVIESTEDYEEVVVEYFERVRGRVIFVGGTECTDEYGIPNGHYKFTFLYRNTAQCDDSFMNTTYKSVECIKKFLRHPDLFTEEWEGFKIVMPSDSMTFFRKYLTEKKLSSFNGTSGKFIQFALDHFYAEEEGHNLNKKSLLEELHLFGLVSGDVKYKQYKGFIKPTQYTGGVFGFTNLYLHIKDRATYEDFISVNWYQKHMNGDYLGKYDREVLEANQHLHLTEVPFAANLWSGTYDTIIQTTKEEIEGSTEIEEKEEEHKVIVDKQIPQEHNLFLDVTEDFTQYFYIDEEIAQKTRLDTRTEYAIPRSCLLEAVGYLMENHGFGRYDSRITVLQAILMRIGGASLKEKRCTGATILNYVSRTTAYVGILFTKNTEILRKLHDSVDAVKYNKFYTFLTLYLDYIDNKEQEQE